MRTGFAWAGELFPVSEAPPAVGVGDAPLHPAIKPRLTKKTIDRMETRQSILNDFVLCIVPTPKFSFMIAI